ncbi:MAG TPA: hypothetical protein VGR78_06770 [Verrucomicrobiae bacterium]|jgi:predicted RNase H-like HicB family nuclease|nr:hypothetical protein [Verrucomicrobiae bacterium]
MTEIIFEVREDEIDGGFTAAALGFGIHTEAETLNELRANVKEAVDCYFDENQPSPLGSVSAVPVERPSEHSPGSPAFSEQRHSTRPKRFGPD